ncbi:MAG: hypothetical protein ACK481_09985 [Candidatus Melainabacteria bacterium]|jgi:hypothetical protein
MTNFFFRLTFIFGLFLLSSQSLSLNADILTQTTDPNLVDVQSKPVKPGFGWGGITLDDSDFYDVPREKCEGESIGEVLKEYHLSNKFYVFKTDKGYGVIELNQTLKEIETGSRRKKNCQAYIGMKIKGELDCKGSARVAKEEPYEGCAFETKVWGHGMSEIQVFELVYKKLQSQFVDYKSKCVLPPQAKPLSERFLKL